MSYLDNNSKFTAVINKRIPINRLMNALAHTTAGLAVSLPPEVNDYLSYQSSDHCVNAQISRFPFIILEAKNSNQLKTLYTASLTTGLKANCFTSSMIGTSAEDQLQKTVDSHSDDLEFWAVLIFGAANHINPLTKKFSLLRNRDEERQVV